MVAKVWPVVIPRSEEVDSGSLATTEPSGPGSDLLVNWEKVLSQLKSAIEVAGGDPKVQGEENLESAEVSTDSSSIRYSACKFCNGIYEG